MPNAPFPTLAQATSVPPDVWSIDFTLEILPRLLEGLWITVQAVFFGAIIALVLGLFLALGRRSSVKLISWPVTGLIEFIRSTPLLVQLFFFFYALPTIGLSASPMVTGVLALGLHFATYASEAYRAGIESVPRGQWEAAVSVNLPRWRTWTDVVLPQAVPVVIPTLGNYVVAMYKEAVLLSFITVLELVGTAQRISTQTLRSLEPYTLAGLLFLAVSIPAAVLVRYLERRYGYART